jgi:Protein of unknown function (DUF3135)
MSGNSINNIDFERWATLASTDPHKFEQLRQDEISAIIDNASGKRKERLRGLQWKIDSIRDKHKHSTAAACLAISELMWETFEQLAEVLQAQVEGGLSTPVPVMQDNIVPFHSK